MKVLVTGSEGYFGSLIISHLKESGYKNLMGMDRIPHSGAIGYSYYQIDLQNQKSLRNVIESERPDAIVHAAAMLAHERPDLKDLWGSNVTATESLASLAAQFKVKKFIFISSNCLWGKEANHAISVDEPYNPVEIYGKSKMQSEIDLQKYKNSFELVIFRSPTIVSSGRLGLLGLLFELIGKNRRIPVMGPGDNRYQFVYGPDYAEAIRLGLESTHTGTYHVGSDSVPTVSEMYEALIQHAGSRSTLIRFPQKLAKVGLIVLNKLRLSPLGPYQYNMLGASFEFETSATKRDFNWHPTLTNSQMFIEAYNFYVTQLDADTSKLSAHKRSASAPILKALKIFL
jgi:nucleoside-diphosphate-sugar epimerase